MVGRYLLSSTPLLLRCLCVLRGWTVATRRESMSNRILETHAFNSQPRCAHHQYPHDPDDAFTTQTHAPPPPPPQTRYHPNTHTHLAPRLSPNPPTAIAATTMFLRQSIRRFATAAESALPYNIKVAKAQGKVNGFVSGTFLSSRRLRRRHRRLTSRE